MKPNKKLSTLALAVALVVSCTCSLPFFGIDLSRSMAVGNYITVNYPEEWHGTTEYQIGVFSPEYMDLDANDEDINQPFFLLIPLERYRGTDLPQSMQVGRRITTNYPEDWYGTTQDRAGFFSPDYLDIDADDEDINQPFFLVIPLDDFWGEDWFDEIGDPEEILDGVAYGFDVSLISTTNVEAGNVRWTKGSFHGPFGEFLGTWEGWFAVNLDQRGGAVIIAVAPEGEWSEVNCFFDAMMSGMGFAGDEDINQPLFHEIAMEVSHDDSNCGDLGDPEEMLDELAAKFDIRLSSTSTVEAGSVRWTKGSFRGSFGDFLGIWEGWIAIELLPRGGAIVMAVAPDGQWGDVDNIFDAMMKGMDFAD